MKKITSRGDYVLDGQVYPLEEYPEAAPYDADEMRALIRAGKLTVGPFYTQFDEWLPGAENMIRNCLYGKRRAAAFKGMYEDVKERIAIENGAIEVAFAPYQAVTVKLK